MTTNPKILKLIQSLGDATASGRVQWLASGISDFFDLILKQGSVTVSRDYEEGRERYFVGLHGEKGRMIESEFFVEEDDGFEAARSLFQVVKRNAYQVDNFIDDVIADLEKTV